MRAEDGTSVRADGADVLQRDRDADRRFELLRRREHDVAAEFERQAVARARAADEVTLLLELAGLRVERHLRVEPRSVLHRIRSNADAELARRGAELLIGL